MNGNCYTKQECDQLGGTASGECAEGYGVCCVCKKFLIFTGWDLRSGPPNIL